MRLVSAHIRGYGRLVDTKVNLDAKVIAVVGPNEAGKTTLLHALTHVDADGAVPVQQRSRAAQVTDETPVIKFDYVLDDDDRAVLADLSLHEPPVRVTISRAAAGGRRTVGLTPAPRKSITQLEAAIDTLTRAHAAEGLDELIDAETTYADPYSDAARDYRGELSDVIDAVRAAVEEPGAAIAESAVQNTESLLSATLAGPEGTDLRGAFQAVLDWVAVPDPAQEARNRIWGRSPDFVLFDEADRSIQSAYPFDENLIANVPPALANLAGTASLDLAELLAFVRSGDLARRRTATVQANSRMDEIFASAWKQSKLSVHLEIDGDQLRIELMENGDQVTVFDERSAGLRTFVALIAFLKVHGSERPTILLIDEAENHLHIDAQADLVNMFVTQEHAVKVIYTTHSPACLPPDLGSGIRTVVPRTDNLQVSDIKNSFWQGSAGYSPLMLAMGAAASAFTPARRVVLAEGATEMILLPSMLRAALDIVEVPYQVAPGLSEVPKDFLPQLDLEAARVAFLVDGDDGGADLKAMLTDQGIPANLIVELGVPGIENLLEPESYREAVASLLRECNVAVPESAIPKLPTLPPADERSWASEISVWIKSHALTTPSKVAVANWLVQNGKARPSALGRLALTEAHSKLSAALGL
jgi:ABC-type transport system involved in cytochrome c biogenesis ATPase subunit